MADTYGVTAQFNARDNVSSVVQKIRNAIGGVTQSTQKVSAGFGTMLKGSAAFSVASKGVDMLKSSLDGAISRFDTMQNFPKIMSIMGSSTKESTAAINLLKKGVDGLPTALDTVAKTTEQLYPAVGNNVNKAAQSTLALNDAFIASGASAEDASRGLLQYTQMLSTGKADMMSWRSLEETMPYALQKVAKSFGITSGSMQDLYKQVQSGKISMKQLNDRFIELDGGVKGFHQAALSATGGIGTAIANMRNRVKAGLTDIIESFDKLIKKVTGSDLAAWINRISSGFKAGLDSIGNRMQGLAGTLQVVWNTLKSSFGEVFGAWKKAISDVVYAYTSLYAANDRAAALDVFKNIVTQITQGLVKLANFVDQNSVKIAQLIPIVLRATTAFIGLRTALNITNTIAQPFLGLATGISTATGKLTQFFGIGAQFQSFGSRALSAANNIKTLGPAGEAARNSISKMVETVDKFGVKSKTSQAAIEQVRNTMSLLGKQDLSTSQEVTKLASEIEKSGVKASAARSGFSQLMANLSPLTTRLSAAKQEFSNLGPNIQKSTAQVKNLGPTMLSFGDSLTTGAQKAVSRTVKAFSGIGTKISDAFNGIKNVGPALLSAFAHPIATIQSLLGTLAGVAGTTGSAITAALGPVGIAIMAIAAVVAAFTVMWNSNFMNIRGVVSSFVSGVVDSFNSMRGTIQPIIDGVKSSLDLLKPVLQGLAIIIGGALMVALAGIMLVVAAAIDQIRFIVTGISTIVIAIKALLTAIAKGGEAIGKFFKGDFKGAAESAKGSVGAIKNGISDIGNAWKNLGEHSAVKNTIESFKQVGKATDDDKKSAEAFKKEWDSASSAIQKNNKANVESFKQIGESMNSAFGSNEGMKGYVQSTETLMTNWANKQVSIQKRANSLMEQAEKASGSARQKLAAKAIDAMLQDQSKGAAQMQQIMNDNNKMLQKGVATNGQKLTDEQKQALRNQNQAIQQALIDQSNMELKAFQLKIQNHEKWTKEDTTRQIAALKQQNTALMAEHESNAQQERELQQKLATAKTATEKNGYQMQLDNLKRSDAQKLAEIDKNNAQIIESMARSGQLTHKTFTQALNQMKISTTNGLQEMLGEVNRHSATMWERMQVMAKYFGDAGKQGTQNFLNAVASGDLQKAGGLMNKQVMQDLSKLPPSMFKGGDDGKKEFLSALSRGNYEAAGEQISDKVNKGLSKSSKGSKGAKDEGTKRAKEISKGLSSQAPAVQKSAEKVSKGIDKGLKSGGKTAKSEGKKVGTNYNSGLKSGAKSVSTTAKQIPKTATNALKSGSKNAKSAGRQVSTGYATGIKSGSGQVRSAVNQLQNAVNNATKAKTGSARSAGAAVGNAYAAGVKSAAASATAAGNSLGRGAANGFNQTKGTNREAGENVGHTIVRAVKSVVNEMRTAGRSLGDALVSGLRSKTGSAQNAGALLGKAAVRGARSQRSGMDSAGSYLASGLAAGMRSGAGAVEEAAASAVSRAVAAAKAKAKIKSPSRVMRDEVGQWLAKGIAVGIDQYSSEAETSARNLISNVRGTLAQESGFQLDTTSKVQVSSAGGLMTMLMSISQQLAQGHQIVLDSGALVGQTAPAYDRRLGQFTKNNGRYQL